MSPINNPQQEETLQNEVVGTIDADVESQPQVDSAETETEKVVEENIEQVNTNVLKQIEGDTEVSESTEKTDESPTGVISSIRSKFRNFFNRKEKEDMALTEEEMTTEEAPKGLFARTKAKFRNFFANMAEKVGPSLDSRLRELKLKQNLSPIEERELTIRQKLATIRPLALAFAVAPIGIPTFGLKPLLTGVAYGAYHILSIASIKAMRARAAVGEKVSSAFGMQQQEQGLAA